MTLQESRIGHNCPKGSRGSRINFHLAITKEEMGNQSKRYH